MQTTARCVQTRFCSPRISGTAQGGGTYWIVTPGKYTFKITFRNADHEFLLHAIGMSDMEWKSSLSCSTIKSDTQWQFGLSFVCAKCHALNRWSKKKPTQCDRFILHSLGMSVCNNQETKLQLWHTTSCQFEWRMQQSGLKGLTTRVKNETASFNFAWAKIEILTALVDLW